MAEFRLRRRSIPAPRHDTRIVWLASIGGVILSFGILLFIGYGPHFVVHRVGPLLIWILVLIVLCALGTDYFALRRRLKRVRSDLTFVLSQEELLRRLPGHPDVQIPLPQLKSLYEESGCLVVTGGDPPTRIAVPKEIENFEVLEEQLMAHAPLVSPPWRFTFGWITLVLSVLCWSLLIVSKDENTTRVAATCVLVLLIWESFQLRRRLLSSPKRVMFWFLVGSAWLSAGFLIYIRVFGGGF